jgi:nicotinate-nucleotide adenylyltransferase
MRIGIFGGTFDPPHIGHSILAAESLHQLQLDKLYWVLTPNPPHKKGRVISSLTDRLQLVQAAIDADPNFELSRIEIDRSPPHFAVDTVRLFGQQNPGAALVYIMGGDSLETLPLWHKPQEFVERCQNLGVVQRPGNQIDLNRLETQIPGITPKIQFVEAPLMEISSTQIRNNLQRGDPVKYYLLPSVLQIIKTRHLYLARASSGTCKN